jgi:thiol-disulfide isomerase/thioredoxin
MDPQSSDDRPADVGSWHDPAPPAGPDATPPEAESPSTSDARGRMSPRTRAWIGMGAVLVALVLLMMLPGSQPAFEAPPPAADGGASGANGDEHAVAGSPAPLQFTLKDMHGVDVNLSSFKGKVLLINFWATWCGPCRVEIPYLIELQQEYGDKLVVLGVSVDDTAEKLKPYANEMKIN